MWGELLVVRKTERHKKKPNVQRGCKISLYRRHKVKGEVESDGYRRDVATITERYKE